MNHLCQEESHVTTSMFESNYNPFKSNDELNAFATLGHQEYETKMAERLSAYPNAPDIHTNPFMYVEHIAMAGDLSKRCGTSSQLSYEEQTAQRFYLLQVYKLYDIVFNGLGHLTSSEYQHVKKELTKVMDDAKARHEQKYPSHKRKQREM